MTCVTLFQKAHTCAAWDHGSYSSGREESCEAVEHIDSEHRGEQVKATSRTEGERGVFFSSITRPCLYDASRVASHIDMPLLSNPVWTRSRGFFSWLLKLLASFWEFSLFVFEHHQLSALFSVVLSGISQICCPSPTNHEPGPASTSSDVIY